jgi:hypothetical protein
MTKRIGRALALLLTPFFVFVGSTGLGSWALASDDRSPAHDAVSVLDLQGAVHHQGEHLAMPVGLAAFGNTLVALDRFAERSVHVVDLGTGDLRRSLGREGEGPGEFKSAYSIDRVANTGELWVFDAGTQRLTRMDLEALDSEGDWAREFVSLRGSARVMNPVHTAEGNVLAVGLFSEGRFGIFDQKGEQVDVGGALPEWSEPIPPAVLQQAFRGTIRSDPARQRFAVGAGWLAPRYRWSSSRASR